MAQQHAAGERVRLAERRDGEPGTLEPERQAADAAEQVKDDHKPALGQKA